MERKFNQGDLVNVNEEGSKKLWIVKVYEPAHEASVLNAFLDENEKVLIPESNYLVTCYWMKGDEPVTKQFREEELTRSSIG